MTTNITHSDVEAFLREELSKIQARTGLYAIVSVQVSRHVSASSAMEVEWNLYMDGHGYLPRIDSSQSAFERIAAQVEKVVQDSDPKVQAARIRDQIAELTKRATELEAL